MDRQEILQRLKDATLEPYQLGLTFRSDMIPPIPERCVSLPAGPLRFVVEARHLDDGAVFTNLGDSPAPAGEEVFDDYGPTLHVHSADDGIEYLRFDCFAYKPHYHYVSEAGAVNTVCRIDQFAEGDVIEWTIGRLRHRLPEMLEHAGLDGLAGQVRARMTEVQAAVDEVAGLLQEAGVRATAERATAERATAERATAERTGV